MPFTGRAIYDAGVFEGVAEDVSETIGMISPFETPLLDILAAPQSPADNVVYEWLEEELGPNTVATSVTDTPAATYFVPHVAGTAQYPFLQAGMVFENRRTGEQIQLSNVAVNTVTMIRGFAATSAATIVAGDSWDFISDAALEGADVAKDLSKSRSRLSNYCQIFKKDIIVSGTMQAVNMLGGIGNEYEHQKMARMKESLRDLEKALIRGKISGNTIGGNAVANTRTFRGLRQSLTTNITSTGTLTPSILDGIIQSAWAGGATDLDWIICDAVAKRAIDSWNTTRIQVIQGQSADEEFKNRISTYEGSFGQQKVMLNRWMPSGTLLVISSGRVKVIPLKGRSFTHVPVANTGDSQKGMIVGEYTVEVKNEKGMAQAIGLT